MVLNPDDRGPSDIQGEENIPRTPEDEGFGDAFLEATQEPGSGPLILPEPDPSPPPSNLPKPPQQQDESNETYEQRWKTLQGIHKHDKEAWEVEKARLESELLAAKTPPAPPPPPTPEIRTPESEGLSMDHLLTPEEKQQMAEYDQDFDTVSKMEGLKRKRELAVLESKMEALKTSIETRISQVTETIAPIAKDIEERTLDSHFSAIRTGHPDFETYRDDGSIKTWIEKKPKYLQPALMRTYSEGSAEDVIDLITDFKRDSNIPITSSSENIVDINSRREQKRQALQSVASRRAPVQSSHAVATDFDAAFDEALRK